MYMGIAWNSTVDADDLESRTWWLYKTALNGESSALLKMSGYGGYSIVTETEALAVIQKWVQFCMVWSWAETRPCRKAVGYLGEDGGTKHILEWDSWDAVTMEDPHHINQTVTWCAVWSVILLKLFLWPPYVQSGRPFFNHVDSMCAVYLLFFLA